MMVYNIGMKMKVETPNAMLPKGSPHSQAIISNNLIFTQGVICLRPDGTMLEGALEEQVKQILNNLKAIVEHAGSDLSKTIKTTIYVTEMTNYDKVNEVYKEYFSEPYPAREIVCVKELPLKANVEISLIAEK
jgi:2-iminobutanoate/2-iminopropanoate deaminase